MDRCRESGAVSAMPVPKGRLREMPVPKKKAGLTTQDLILIAVLLAAGAVLKLTVGSVLTFAGM